MDDAMNNERKLAGKAAIVTGGSRGIGRAICLALARQGASVVVNFSKSESEALAVVEAIRESGGTAMACQADVSDESAVRSMVDAAAAAYGRIDILVNNAGWTRLTPHRELDRLSDEIIDRTLAVNMKGPLICCRAVIPVMQRSGGGAIVNITSVAGRMGVGSTIAYAGSKAALSAMTKALARAFAPEIRVNAVAPGMVDTHFADWTRADVEKAREHGHIARLVTVEDVAAVVLFLVTDGSALTGEEIVVDGGIVALGPRG